MSQAKIPALMELTPFNPDFQADPHSILEPLRAECPVRRDEAAGVFMISRYEDVRALATDRTMWRDPLRAEPDAMFTKRLVEGGAGEGLRSETTSILMLDDPDHARIRGPLMQAFYARVAKCRPHVEEIVETNLKRLDGQASFDLMDQFCVPVPIDVIAWILGVDHERLPEFRTWSEDVIQSLNPLRTPEQTERMERASEALSAYFLEAMNARRADPGDDLISDMVKLQAEGAVYSDHELQLNLGALLVGGNLTTTDLIGNAVRLLLINPGELAKLKADPSLINSLVEETLRYEPPVDITARVASQDLEVGGCPVRQTQSMVLMLRGANRDPEVFPDPDRFDISRKGKPHMAFGGGAHICIGAPLARLEAQVAIARLFERFPDLKLAHPDAPPQWRTLPFFRGLQHLELRAS